MTVEATNVLSGPYIGNGIATSFPITFAAASEDEVAVEINGIGVDPSLYTTTLLDDRTGTVNFLVPPVGTLYIYSNPDFTQEVNFEDQGPYFQSALNEPNDRSAIRDLWLYDKVMRTVLLPRGETSVTLPPAASRASKVFGFDAAGNPIMRQASDFVGPQGLPGGNVMSVGTFAQMALNSTIVPVGTDIAYTSAHTYAKYGAARYVYDATLNSAFQAAHPTWTFISPAYSIYAARVFRIDPDWYVRPEYFGGVDGSPLTGTAGVDITSAWTAMNDYLTWDARNPSSFYKGARSILLMGNCYYSTTTIQLKLGQKLAGVGLGLSGGEPCAIRYAANIGGVAVQRYDTLADGADPAPGGYSTGGDGCIIEGILFQSDGGTVSSTTAPVTLNQEAVSKSGIWMRARAKVINCLIRGFAGLGVAIVASTAFANPDFRHGNANNWVLDTVRIERNKAGGLAVEGADTNAGKATSVDCSSNGGWGFYDNSFLGNTYEACHSDANGLYGSAGVNKTSVVSDGTYRYGLINGQDTAALTTAPTTGTDNSVWRYIGLGGPVSVIPLYVSGGPYVSGGSYIHLNNNARTVYDGCYEEGGQNPHQIAGLAKIDGGFMGVGWNSGAPYTFGSPGLGTRSHLGYFMQSVLSSGTLRVGIGTENALGTVLFASHSVGAPATWRQQLDYVTGDLRLTYAASVEPMRWTGPSTTRTYGQSAAVPYVAEMTRFALGNGANARIVGSYSGAPPSGTVTGKGDTFRDISAGAGGKAFYVTTTAGTVGSTAVLKQCGVIDA